MKKALKRFGINLLIFAIVAGILIFLGYGIVSFVKGKFEDIFGSFDPVPNTTVSIESEPESIPETSSNNNENISQPEEIKSVGTEEVNETASTSENSAKNPTQNLAPASESYDNIIFGDVTYQTSNSVDEALKNTIKLPNIVSRGCTIQGFPSPETYRMRVWVDYVSSGELPKIETSLYSENTWTSDLNLSSLAGKTIVLAFCCQTNDFIPKATYKYIAFEIPSVANQ